VSAYSIRYARERRRTRRRAGVCYQCGSHPAIEDRTLCARCKKKSDARYRKPRVFHVEGGHITVLGNRIVKVPKPWKEWRGRSWHLFKAEHKGKIARRVKLMELHQRPNLKEHDA